MATPEDLGQEAVPAASGKEALDINRGRKAGVHLVITDYAMPHMTGLQLAKAIEKEWPGLTVILASGYAEMEDDAEMNLPKLAKPFTQAELAEQLAVSFQAHMR